MSTVNPKESSTGSHTDHPYTITIVSLRCDVICDNISKHSVTGLYVNEIFISDLLLSVLEVHTLGDFNIYIYTDKTINRSSDKSRELC